MGYRRGKHRNGQVEVTVEVEDVLDALDDQVLLAELRERKLVVGQVEWSYFDRDYAERALDALHRHRVGEAVALLDMALHPVPILVESLKKPGHAS